MSAHHDYRYNIINYEGKKYFVSMVLETFPQTLKARQIYPDTRYDYLDGVSIDEVERSSLRIDDFDELTGALLSSIYSSSHENLGGPSFRCNTEFKPYQFRPLIKYHKNDQDRILIADETGLGKTIEAGYILVEELARQDLKKVLILSPAHLRYKWRGELWNRFGLRFEVLKSSQQLKSKIEEQDRFYGIASMDLASSLKSGPADLYFQDYDLDMLMIDEIHHMIGRDGETNRRRLGLSLSLISDRCVGITAAPIQIDIHDLKRVFDIVYPGRIPEGRFEEKMRLTSKLNEIYWLLSKDPLDHEDKQLMLKKMRMIKDHLDCSDTDIDKSEVNRLYSDMQDLVKEGKNRLKYRFDLREKAKDINPFTELYTMSKAIEVGEARFRDVENIKISLDEENVNGFQGGELVEISEKDLFEEIQDVLKDSFSGIHLFQLSSCLPAMLGLMRKGMEGLSVWNPEENRFDHEREPISDGVKDRCKELADRYGLIEKDTKWNVLVDKLKEMKSKDRKTIVFTQWIPTLRFFDRKRKEIEGKTFLISSDEDNYTRKEKASTFQDYDGFAVLFTTDILSEGIDLQSASAVINYDFPTNPQSIEQRIGRVDRVGQERESVKIMNLIVEGGKDEEWLPKIKERLEEQRKGIGFSRNVLEKREKDFIEDKDEIMDLLRYKYRDKLKEEIVLWGIDDALDEDIKSRHEELKREGYDLRWTCIRNMFKAISGEGGVSTEIHNQGERCVLSNVRDFDISVVRDLLRKKHERKVIGNLKRYRKDDKIDLDLTSGDHEGMDIPFHHPLFNKAISISNTAFSDDLDFQSEDKKDVPKITSKKVGGPYDKRYLLLAEADIELMGDTEKSHFWFTLGDRLDRLEDFSLETLYMDHEKGKIHTDFDGFKVDIDFTNLKEKIRSDLEDWFEERYESLKSSILLEKEREFKFLDWRINKRENEKDMKNMEKNKISSPDSIDQLEGLEKEIESLKKDAEKEERHLRLIAIFRTGLQD